MKKSIESRDQIKRVAPGDRAFVYQQAFDLPHPVGVSMSCQKGWREVTFILDPLNKKWEVTGKSKSFISAAREARQKAQRKINLMAHPYDYEEKEALVNILKSNLFIH